MLIKDDKKLVINGYTIIFNTNYEIERLGLEDNESDYFKCFISASISLPDTQIDRYIESRVEKGDLQKRTEHNYDKKIMSSEGVEGSFLIMDRIVDGQISLQVVIPEKAVKSIHDDNSINEEEKKEKIQKTLEDLNDKVLIPELKSLFSIIQEQTQSNAGTTR